MHIKKKNEKKLIQHSEFTATFNHSTKFHHKGLSKIKLIVEIQTANLISQLTFSIIKQVQKLNHHTRKPFKTPKKIHLLVQNHFFVEITPKKIKRLWIYLTDPINEITKEKSRGTNEELLPSRPLGQWNSKQRARLLFILHLYSLSLSQDRFFIRKTKPVSPPSKWAGMCLKS